MKYKITELIDIDKVNMLMYEFNKLTGIPIGIIDNEGKTVFKSGIQEICLKFHRNDLINKSICVECTRKRLQLIGDKKQIQYKCPCGLLETFTPIIVNEKHIANLFIGQFLYEKPDNEYFKNSAINYGYYEDLYLKVLEKVPVLSKDKIESTENFFLRLSEIISDMALVQLKMKEEERLIIRQNENKLKESEERYKNLLEMLPYGILVRDNKKVLFINKQGAEFIGFNTAKEVTEKNLEELFYPHPDYEEKFYNNLKTIEDEGRMPLTEEKFLRKCDNKVLNVETVVTAIPYNGVKAVLVVFRDISERKRIDKLKMEIERNALRLQQTLEYDRLRTEFFSNISHELKTPINVIFSAIQTFYYMINQTSVSNKDKIDNYLYIMKQNCLRLIRLVNNLLDITKIDAGYLKVELVNCDIISTVENIVLSVAEYIKNKGIEIIFDTEIEEKIVACDRDKIERIILNLLSNATKFTQFGGEIFVYIKEENDNIVISVRDTGIGIPIEKQKVIFERFVQVDKSLSRRQEGSGIGLSLVKSMVEMHKGKIYVNSKYTKGSEFIVELPVTVIEDNYKEEESNYSNQMEIDKINIEFSDIYT